VMGLIFAFGMIYGVEQASQAMLSSFVLYCSFFRCLGGG